MNPFCPDQALAPPTRLPIGADNESFVYPTVRRRLCSQIEVKILNLHSGKLLLALGLKRLFPAHARRFDYSCSCTTIEA
jgi:hypothetical protein